MAHDYIPKAKRYRSGGKFVSRKQVRDEVNKLTAHVSKESVRIAKSYQAGKINLAEFEIRMRDLLRSAHIVASSVGKGGRQRMTQADWGRVGAKIKWQYGYLTKFARKIGRKAVSDAALLSRSASYASSIYVSFARTFQESQTEFVKEGVNPEKCRLVTNSEEGCAECEADEAAGWMSVDDMQEIGSRICGDWCRCSLEFEDDVNLSELEFEIKITVDED